MKKNEKPNEQIHFSLSFNQISPYDLNEIMEWLQDNKYLSPEGEEFKTKFWELLIKSQ